MLHIYRQIEQVLEIAEQVIYAAREQNYDKVNRTFSREFMLPYQSFLTSLFSKQDEFLKMDLQIDTTSFIQLTSQLLEAQEQRDYVLLADYLELQLQPLVLSVLDTVRELTDPVRETNYIDTNVLFFEEFHKSCGGNRSRTENSAYQVEPTQSGHLTLKRSTETEIFYFHSNVNPWKEADCLVRTYADDTAREYAVLGLGLGYHVIRLWQRCFGAIPVHIYETDERVLELAERYQDFSPCTERNFHIHYDKELKCLSEKLREEGVCLIPHYPSLRNIANSELRAAFDKFFIKDSSERNQKKYLYANFTSNIHADVLPIERLQEKWQGKNIYIIAAGPSLDKNLSLLKKKPDNSIILATSTVLGKMLPMGIRPDYGIVIDANERVIRQVSALKHCGVPLLLLSTACYRYALEYTAVKYIFFQKDFDRAEQYAQEHGRMLFETGGSVSTAALDVAIRFRAGKIIFLGLDLAFTNNLAHAAGTSSQTVADEEELIEVRSCDGGVVYSDYKFNIYASWIEERLRRKDLQGITVINATEGGRYIQGMVHMGLKNVLDGKKEV